jgi:hypothetical protein
MLIQGNYLLRRFDAQFFLKLSLKDFELLQGFAAFSLQPKDAHHLPVTLLAANSPEKLTRRVGRLLDRVNFCADLPMHTLHASWKIFAANLARAGLPASRVDENHRSDTCHLAQSFLYTSPTPSPIHSYWLPGSISLPWKTLSRFGTEAFGQAERWRNSCLTTISRFIGVPPIFAGSPALSVQSAKMPVAAGKMKWIIQYTLIQP